MSFDQNKKTFSIFIFSSKEKRLVHETKSPENSERGDQRPEIQKLFTDKAKELGSLLAEVVTNVLEPRAEAQAKSGQTVKIPSKILTIRKIPPNVLTERKIPPKILTIRKMPSN